MMQRFIQQSLSVMVAAVVLAPQVALAAPRDFIELVDQLVGLIDLATVALVAAAVLFFFFSTVRNLYGTMQGDEQKKQELQKTLFMGIIIIFVMVSIWGIIQILQQTLTRGLL